MNYISCLPYLKVLIWLVACHHRNYACYHLPTRERAGIKIGDVDTSQTYLNFLLSPCMFCVTLHTCDALSYTFDHIWTNLLTQCTSVPVLVFCCFSISGFPILKVLQKFGKNQI